MNVPSEFGLIIAFGAGVLSFFSPCVVPLIPGYVALISGLSLQELKEDAKGKTFQILIPFLLFILGFTLVFTVLGASASFIGKLLIQQKAILTKIAGVIIIFFGLFLIGLMKIPFLYRERRFHFATPHLGIASLPFLGAAFGFAWTPCIGPVLSGILLYASTVGTVSKGALLLFIYSLGLAIPFLVTALFLSRVLTALTWVKRHYQIINILSGSFLILMGILLITNLWNYISIFFKSLSTSL